jgi:hypothetical protein
MNTSFPDLLPRYPLSDAGLRYRKTKLIYTHRRCDPAIARLLDIRHDSLKPYLVFIAVRIANEGIRQARSEFATRSDGTTGALDRRHGRINIFRPGKSKSEVNYSAGDARAGSTFLKSQDVVLPGAQRLNGGVASKIFTDPKDRLIER